MRSSFFRCWLGRGASGGAGQVRPARHPRRRPSPTVAPDSCCLDAPALRPTVTPAAAGSAAAGLDAPVFAQEPLLLDIIVFFFVTTRERKRCRRFSPPRRRPIPRPAAATARLTPHQPPRAPEARAIIRPISPSADCRLGRRDGPARAGSTPAWRPLITPEEDPQARRVDAGASMGGCPVEAVGGRGLPPRAPLPALPTRIERFIKDRDGGVGEDGPGKLVH